MDRVDSRSDRGRADRPTGLGLSRRELLDVFGGGAVLVLTPACSRSPKPALSGVVGDEPLHYASLLDVAKLIEAQEFSPVELTRGMLERIETFGGPPHRTDAVPDRARLRSSDRLAQAASAGLNLPHLEGQPGRLPTPSGLG